MSSPESAGPADLSTDDESPASGEVAAVPGARTAIEVERFGGTLDGVVPGTAVLVGLDLLLGTVAVYLLSRASSSDVK